MAFATPSASRPGKARQAPASKAASGSSCCAERPPLRSWAQARARSLPRAENCSAPGRKVCAARPLHDCVMTIALSLRAIGPTKDLETAILLYIDDGMTLASRYPDENQT